MDLSGRRVLVTGASRGIGEALARCFSRAGAQLALVAGSEAPLKALADELGGVAFPTDLADPNAVDGLIDRVEADGGAIDVLVNNAGIDSVGAFQLTDPDVLERTYRVNLLTPVHLCRQVIPGMLERGSGHIVNVASLAGTAVFPGLTHLTDVSRETVAESVVAAVQHGPVPAANAGTVVFAGPLSIYGNTIVVDHGLGLQTLYAHLSTIGVKEGEPVSKGQELGRTGSTGLALGDHLHFEVLINGVSVTPLEWWDARWIRDHIGRPLREGGLTMLQSIMPESAKDDSAPTRRRRVPPRPPSATSQSPERQSPERRSPERQSPERQSP